MRAEVEQNEKLKLKFETAVTIVSQQALACTTIAAGDFASTLAGQLGCTGPRNGIRVSPTQSPDANRAVVERGAAGNL